MLSSTFLFQKYFFTETQKLMLCLQPYDKFKMAIFASSAMNGFHLNNPHINKPRTNALQNHQYHHSTACIYSILIMNDLTVKPPIKNFPYSKQWDWSQCYTLYFAKHPPPPQGYLGRGKPKLKKGSISNINTKN